MELYNIQGLRFQYPGRFQLDIDEFSLAAGEKLSFVGRNGSGKTTLLRILAFLERPESCTRFSYQGRELNGKSPDRSRMGFLKQQPWIFNNSVSDNLSYSLKVRRLNRKEIHSKVEKMAEWIGLSSHLKEPARSLSGGEQKRLALGRVLIANPEIILLDEPMAHLDGGSQEIVEELLRRCEATLLFTTHDLRLAMSLSDRILTLKGGRISKELPANILVGRCEGSTFISRGGLEIPMLRPAPGPHVVAAIDPHAIVISREPLRSSMQNGFPGRIESIHADENVVWLEIETGEKITAIISRASYEKMELNLHSKVFVSFKST
ncbi:MAG: ABC transporter ATP-binding protein, partial [Candidatus Eisenbacteria bacterium]|nr:ABC transporter ATP-binding protein [Candidatus Eisenbacteria bacterium]